MRSARLSWRDRVLPVNGVLYCLVGVGLIARYFTGPAARILGILGMVFLVFGIYRLARACTEMRKRAGSNG